MSFRPKANLSRNKSRFARTREKANLLRTKVKQSLSAFASKFEQRISWWRRAFRTPAIGVNWFVSRCSSLWAAFIAFLGLDTRSFLSKTRRPASVRQNLFRTAMCEGLESRQLMAVMTADQPGDFVMVNDVAPAGFSAGDTVSWKGFDGVVGGADDITGLTVGVNAFGSIQDAINTSLPGDTIKVGPGVYTETLSIAKELTIQGAQNGVDARGRSSLNESIIDSPGANNAAVNVTADNVVFDGFTVTRTGALNDTTGIASQAPAKGFAIRNNIITNQSIGYYANSGGAASFEQNSLSGNLQLGAAGGAGIYSEKTSGLVVQNNDVTGQIGPTANNPVLFAAVNNGDHVNLTFQGNKVTGNDYGALFIALDGASIKLNTVSTVGAAATGLTIADGSKNVTVESNVLDNNLRGLRIQDFGFGVAPAGPLPISNVTVVGNSLANSTNPAEALFVAPSSYSGVLNASGNYWGTTSPASAATKFTVPSGVSVDFSPMLKFVDSNPLQPGYQESASTATRIVHTLGANSEGINPIQNAYQLSLPTPSVTTLEVRDGTYSGNVDLSAAANRNVNLAAGSSPGQVIIGGNLTLNSGDTLPIEVSTNSLPSGYDNFVVTGTVTLNNPTLVVSGAPVAPGSVLTIINNDGGDAVIGTFNGLPEGAAVVAGGQVYKISYVGGDGNDVTLQSLALTIDANDTPPAEGGANGQFSVYFSDGTPSGRVTVTTPVTVDFVVSGTAVGAAAAGGSAANPNDYLQITSPVVIPANATEGLISVVVFEDTTAEITANERVEITLTQVNGVGLPPAGGFPAPGPGLPVPGQLADVVTIVDNDPTVVTLSVTDNSINPENSADTASFRFALSKPSSTPTNVWLTIPTSGTSNAQFTDWTFSLSNGATLSGLNAGTPSASTESRSVSSRQVLSDVATITVTSPHNYSVGQVVNVNGVSGISNGNYSITAIPSATEFSFAFVAADLAAGASGGTVQTTSNVLLSIPQGVTEVVMTVSSVADNIVELNEVISVTMNSLKGPGGVVLPSLATIGTPGAVTASIVDDDTSTITLLPAPTSTLSGNDPDSDPGSDNVFPSGTNGGFVVQLTNPASQDTVISYTISAPPANGNQVFNETFGSLGAFTFGTGTGGQAASIQSGQLELRRANGTTPMTSANHATFSVDLSGIKTSGGAVLTFDQSLLGGETTQNFAGLTIANAFLSNATPDVDGVSISVDGTTFFPVANLGSSSSLTINLERALYDRGLEPTNNVRIRISQFDGSNTNNSGAFGRRFDNIRVVTGDYVNLSGSVTVAAGLTQATIPMQVINDYVVEGSENLTITLTARTAGNPDVNLDPIALNLTRTATITDGDTAVAVIDNFANSNESGLVNGRFRVRLMNEAHNVPMRSDTQTTIPFQVTNLVNPNATYGVDYTLGTFANPDNVVVNITQTSPVVKGNIVLPAGVTQGFIQVNVIQETAVEDDEYVTIELLDSGSDQIQGDSGIGLSTSPSRPAVATSVIQDEDSAFIRVNAIANASEPSGMGKFVVDLVRTTDLVNPVVPIVPVVSNVDTVVTYTVSGTATPGAASPADYATLTGTVTIAAGQNSAFIDVSVFDDLNLEPTETVIVTLTGKIAGDSSATILASQSSDSVDILDNDTLKLQVVAGSNAAEPATNSSFTIRLDNSTPAILAAYQAERNSIGSSASIVVTYTVSGTASNGIDYATLSGTATIPFNATSVVLPVNVINDSVFDPNETVTVTLDSITAQPALGLAGSGVEIDSATKTGTVTIIDDEAGGLSITRVTPAREANSDGSVTFGLTGPSPFNTVFTYAVTPSGAAPIATQGSDHTFNNATLTITAGQTEVTVVVPVVNDNIQEDEEVIPVQITGFVAGGNGGGYGFNGSPVNVPILADATVDIVNVIHGKEGVAASTVANRVLNNNIATITTTGAHGYVNGQTVTISGVNNGAFNGTFTIFNVTANTFSFVSFNSNVASGSSSGTVTPAAPAFIIGMQSPAAGNVTVSYAIVPAPGSAIDGVDFTSLAPFTATIPAGQTTVSVSLANINDAIIEDTEKFSIRLIGLTVSNPADSDITIGAAVPSITATDTQGSLIVGRSTTGAAGLSTVTFSRAHDYLVGQSVLISGTGDANFDGTRTITAVSGNSISFASVGSALAPVSSSGFVSAAVTPVTNKVLTSNVATLTVPNHAFKVGQSIRVAIGDAAFDGNFIISAISPSTISYARVNANVASAASGGVIELDAGDLPATAVTTSGSYSLTTITGTLSSGSDRDMFLINITDPAKFAAETISTAFDTQLFLFAADGKGIVSDDNSGTSPLSLIGNPVSNLVPAPGLYYLAISSSNSDPTSGGNNIWLNDTNTSPSGIGALGAVDGWSGVGGTFGQYTIKLAGATFGGYNTTATTSIADNDAGFIQVTGQKGKEGVDDVKFTITQSAISSSDTVVTYSLGTVGSPASSIANPNGPNADHTLDYSPVVYTATIAAGSTSVVVTVPVVDDSIVETDTETVTLTLLNLLAPTDPQIKFGTVEGPTITFQQGNPIGSSGINYNGTLDTFINNDIPGQEYSGQSFISVSPLSPPTFPNGPLHGLIQFNNIIGSNLIPANSPISSATLNFSGPLGGAVTIAQALQAWAPNGTWSSLFGGNGIQQNGVEASGGFVSGTGSFSGSALNSWVQSWVNGGTNNGMAILPGSSSWDAFSSENSSVSQRPRLTITVATSASAVIEDNDSAKISITPIAGKEPGGSIAGAYDPMSPTVGQANAGKAVVSIDKVSSTNTVITYTITDGTATGGGIDHNAPTSLQTLTIPAGQTSATILIEVVDDNTVEGTENVTVSLQSITSFDPQITFDATKSVTVNINDNDVGLISIAKVKDGAENNPINPIQTFSITNKVLTSNIATLTTSVNHSYTVGEQVLVSIGDAIFDGEYVVTAVTANTFSYQKANLNIPSTAVAGGTATAQPYDGRFIVTTTNASDTQTLIPYQIVITSPNDANAKIGASVTPHDPQDYVLRNNGTVLTGTLTLPPLLTSAEITVDVLEDYINEGDENVTIKLLPPISGKLALSTSPGADQATVIIEDDDDLEVSIDATDDSVNERDGGVDDGYFTIQMNYASDSDVLLTYVISGTATQSATAPVEFVDSNKDYKPLPGTGSSSLTRTITIAAGQTTSRINVEAYEDFVNEPDETVIVTLQTPIVTVVPTTTTVSNNTNKTLGTASDTVTIVDTDFAVSIERTDSPATEDGLLLGGFNGRFTVFIANPLPVDLIVNLQDVTPVAAGRALIGADYTYDSPNPSSPTQTVKILAGQTSAQLNVIVLPDSISEGDETIDMQITGFTVAPPALTAPAPAALYIDPLNAMATETIFDNDKITVTITGTNGKDLAGPTGNEDGKFTFNQGLVSPYYTKISYVVEPTGTTATAGSDYTAIPAGYITIAPGATTAEITLDVLGDIVVEGNETVQLKITNVESFVNTGLTVAAPNSVAGTNNTGTATIIDEDSATLKIIGSSGASEPAGVGAFTIEQSAPSSTDTVIVYSVSGGTATNGSDYTLSPLTTATIFAGQTQAFVLVNVADDNLIEATPETVQLSLAANPTGPTDPQITVDPMNQTASIAINDNDLGRVTITKISDGTEGGANGQFRLTLVEALSGLPTVTTDLSTIVTYQVEVQTNAPTKAATPGASNTNVVNGPDYQTLTGTAVIPAGQSTANIDVTVFDDSFVELLEYVNVRLVAATNAQPRAIGVSTPSFAVTNKALSGNVATLTATGHTYVAGQTVVVAIGDPVFDSGVGNGGFLITSVVPGVSFSYSRVNPNVASAPTTGFSALTGVSADSFASLNIIDNDTSTLTISGGAFAEGNKIFDQAGATLTLSLTNAFDVPTTWTVNYQGGTNTVLAVSSKSLTSNVATLTVPSTAGLIVGQKVGVQLTPADPTFDGIYTITSLTATTISYTKVAANVLPTATAGNATISGGATASGLGGGQDDNNAGSDFDATPDVVVIPAGATSVTVKVDFNEEDSSIDPLPNLVEDNEIFLTNVSGSLPAGYTVTNDGKSTVTINNDDTAAYSINDVSVTEGNPFVTPFAGWTASLTGNVVTINTPGVHGFVVGQTLEITGFANSVFNGRYIVLGTPSANSFTYAKTNANVALTAPTTGTVTTFPQTILTFNLTVNNPVDMGITVNVNYTDVSGVLGAVGQTYTLTVPIAAGTDYDKSSDSVTFPALSTGTQTVSVAINPDFIVEGGTANNFGSETFKASTSVASSSFNLIPQGGRLFNNSDEGVGTIVDNDSAVISSSVTDALASEPSPVNNGQIRISQSNPSSTDTVIEFSLGTGGTNAVQGVDYDLFVGSTKLTNSLTIPAGATEVFIDVVAISDNVLEVDEFVNLMLSKITSSDPNISLPMPQPVNKVQINDNDTALLTVAKVQDGNEVVGGAPINGLFTISLTQASDSDTVVHYRVLNPAVPADVLLGAQSPAATPGSDYTALYTGATGTVTITAGQTTTTITVNVIDDFVPNEGTEKVTIRLESFVGNPDIDLTTGPRSATVDILDDADGLFVKVEKERDASEPGNGPQDGQFKVTLVNSLGMPVVLPIGSTGGGGGLQVNFALNEAGSGGTAVSPTDYVNATSVVIPEGASSALVTIDVQDDNAFEGTETVKIRLLGTSPTQITHGVSTEPVSVSTGSPAQTTVGNALYPNLASLDIVDDEVAAGAKVESVVLSNGQAQRSGIKSLTVVLDQPVNAPSAGFIVRKRDDLPGGLVYTGTVAGVIATPDYVSQPGKTVVTLTFAPNSTFVDSTGGLVDGNYEVELVASLITTLVGTYQLDGDGNGTGGDNYRFGDDAADSFYRLYGDADGDGDVDPIDLFNFVVPALSTPTSNLWLDGDLDGDVDPIDLFNFVIPKLVTLRNLNGFPN
jgi:hypothetical protein